MISHSKSLSTVLGEGIEERNGEVRYNCPFCLTRVGKEDTKHHLYVNEGKGKYHCFRCEASGTLFKLFQDLQISTVSLLISKYNLDRRASSTKINNVSPVDSLPDDVVEADDFSPGYMYLRYTRNIPDFVLNTRKFLYSKKKKMIIFPVYDTNGKLVYWQGRSTVSRWFYNPTGSNKSNFLYGLEYVDVTKKFVVITEGVITSLNVPNGVACFGKDVSDVQLDILSKFIKEHNIEKVYFGLDNDFFYKNYLCLYELKNRIPFHSFTGYIPLLPIGKDFADISYEENVKLLENTVPCDLGLKFHKFMVEASRQIYHNTTESIMSSYGKIRTKGIRFNRKP